MTTNNSSPSRHSLPTADADQARLARSFIILAGCLTLLMAALSLWEYLLVYRTATQMAETDSRSSFNKDLVYRRWATSHGGVYVPSTEQTPPNPYLAHIPEREITTPSGKKLTLMNPAYMIRQVYELAQTQYGTQGHITSLNPIRPENAPDAWETKALQSFAAGAEEVSSVEMIDNEPYLRLMRPMLVEAGCLKCHAQQGYKTGDIRGGISVSVPLTPYLTTIQGQAYPVYFGYGLVWVIGLLGLWLTESKFSRELLVRRQADTVLQQSEARYRNFFENNYSIMLVIDPESGDIVDANPAAADFYGWSVEELKQKKITDINTATPDEVAAEIARATAQTRGYFIFQHQIADGTVRDVEVYSGPLQTVAKVMLFSVVHDITKRRLADLALRASEERYRQAVENSPNPIFSIDRWGRIQSWNASCQRVFQYEEPETVGRSVSLILWDDGERNAIETALTTIWQGNSIESREVAFRSRDNTHRFAISRLYPVFDINGVPQLCVFANTDITARKRAEDEVRHSLKEKEVMLKEIHHRVKNNMQVIYSLLNLQALKISDSAVRAVFEESKNRVNSMALIHEKLYQSKDFASIDFNEYLQRLASGIAETYKRQDVAINVEMEPLHLDVNVGVPCGLIVNELVSNSLKHAFPDGRKGTIIIGINTNSEGMRVLTVSDNGIGFPAAIDFNETTSLGLQLVTVLTGQIHGTIALSREAGTKFTITFPGPSEGKGLP